jgi:hypothetical protein
MAPDPEHGATKHEAAALRAVLRLILAAAIVTAPLYVVGETFDLSHARRVLMINGGTAVGALALLLLVRRGRAQLAAALSVLALFTLISWLAATNGESIHVNVVNFVLVLVLANLLLEGRGVAIVTVACATVMAGIAYHQSRMATGPQSNEIFIEAVIQFLPSFILIALFLRMTSRKVTAPRLPER